VVGSPQTKWAGQAACSSTCPQETAAGSGNRAIMDGTLGAVMLRAAERWKREAMYYDLRRAADRVHGV
jgi:hypothetical protein